jgi:hypothetical protein
MDGGTQGRSAETKQGRSRGQPRLGRRAKTQRITSDPGKSVGVLETGGSGRRSDEEWDNRTHLGQRTRGLRGSFNQPEAGGVDNTHPKAGGHEDDEGSIKPIGK